MNKPRYLIPYLEDKSLFRALANALTYKLDPSNEQIIRKHAQRYSVDISEFSRLYALTYAEASSWIRKGAVIRISTGGSPYFMESDLE